MYCNLELQGHGRNVSARLLVHLLTQKREGLRGNFRLPVGCAHLFPGGIRLPFGVSGIVDVDRGQHHDQQHIGHGGIRHHLIDAETEYLL